VKAVGRYVAAGEALDDPGWEDWTKSELRYSPEQPIGMRATHSYDSRPASRQLAAGKTALAHELACAPTDRTGQTWASGRVVIVSRQASAALHLPRLHPRIGNLNGTTVATHQREVEPQRRANTVTGRHDLVRENVEH
jgi:hypothetical protein